MALTQPLGPLFVDVSGTELLVEEREVLSHPMIGGVILFSRNFESTSQLTNLVSDLKALREPSLLIGVDQEGGRVQRFQQDFTRLPAARRYGEVYDANREEGLAAARSGGYIMAMELRGPGVDFSFAPVLDVAGVDSTVIGNRAFHRDPVVVTALAGAFIEGMYSGGMKSVGKHFPGHGFVSEDSHECLPRDHRTRQAIVGVDLLPYYRLRGVLHGVMTAHVLYPEIDEELPTYSTYWLQHVLRDEVGFKGVVFSDDLSMDGANRGAGPEDRATAAINAGCDMILVCNDPNSVQKILDCTDVQPPKQTLDPVLAMMGHTPDMARYESALSAIDRVGEGFVESA